MPAFISQNSWKFHENRTFLKIAISSQQLKIKRILTPHWKLLGTGYTVRFILLSRDRTFWRRTALLVISLKFLPLGYMENFISPLGVILKRDVFWPYSRLPLIWTLKWNRKSVWLSELNKALRKSDFLKTSDLTRLWKK